MSGIRSRATRGRDTSQESERLSITGGKAMLHTDDMLSTGNVEGTTSPNNDREKLNWSPQNQLRASEDLADP